MQSIYHQNTLFTLLSSCPEIVMAKVSYSKRCYGWGMHCGFQTLVLSNIRVLTKKFCAWITVKACNILYICFRALQEAQDIFGVDFDYGILETLDEDGYEEEEEEEDEYVDEEGEDPERRCCQLRMTASILMCTLKWLH